MLKYSIAFANRQRLVRIDRRGLRRLARSLLTRELVASAEISVAIVDDSQMQSINRQFLNHDFATDVISFAFDGDDSSGTHAAPVAHTGPKGTNSHRPPLERQTEGRATRTVRRGFGKSISGEIVMSTETAVRAAADCNTSPEYELALYLVHGLLHLCGYDDTSPVEKRLMRRREAEALREWKMEDRG
jgi:probable rRNA maturation factor